MRFHTIQILDKNHFDKQIFVTPDSHWTSVCVEIDILQDWIFMSKQKLKEKMLKFSSQITIASLLNSYI